MDMSAVYFVKKKHLFGTCWKLETPIFGTTFSESLLTGEVFIPSQDSAGGRRDHRVRHLTLLDSSPLFFLKSFS